TQVANLQKQFAPNDIAPAVIVYERAGGITAADQAKAAADAKAFATVEGVTGKVTGPIPSQDKQALQTIVPIKVDQAGWEKIADTVAALKTTANDGSNGVSVYVTGPAGNAADSASAFQGIDGTLLYTTLI